MGNYSSTQQQRTGRLSPIDSYDRIFGWFYHSDVSGVKGRAVVAIKDYKSAEATFAEIGQPFFNQLGSCDMSAIFMPYKTSGSGFMPSVPSGVLGIPSGVGPNAMTLMPFHFDGASGILNNVIDPSGSDSIRGIASSDTYIGNSQYLREKGSSRPIGIRLPAVGVGWGYTVDGEPWPSGASGVFSGSHPSGYMVDPEAYVAAPIDLRYDKSRHVWTHPSEFTAEITSCSGIYYSWVEKLRDTDGNIIDHPTARSGTINPKYNTAVELNHFKGIPPGTIVSMHPKDGNGNYVFDRGVTDEYYDTIPLFYENEDTIYHANLLRWEIGTLYHIDQLIYDDETQSQYIALETHVSTSGNRPPSDKWEAALTHGVETTELFINASGIPFEAAVTYDSHGQISHVYHNGIYHLKSFWAQLRTESDNNIEHSFIEYQRDNNQVWEEKTDGEQGISVDINAREGVPSGTMVLMHKYQSPSGSIEYLFDITAGVLLDSPTLDSHDTWNVQDQGFTHGAVYNVLSNISQHASGLTLSYRDITVDGNGNTFTVASGSTTEIDINTWASGIIQITASGVSDGKVYVSETDTTRDYLDNTLETDNIWIAKDIVDNAGDEAIRLNHIGPSDHSGYLDTTFVEGPETYSGTYAQDGISFSKKTERHSFDTTGHWRHTSPVASGSPFTFTIPQAFIHLGDLNFNTLAYCEGFFYADALGNLNKLSPPTGDGDYFLKLNKSGSSITISWEQTIECSGV